jgi:hypothetical protein
MKALVLVTGDIVLDCHLYGGVRTSATSVDEPGTTYHQSLGGAALTCRLLAAAADTAGREWDEKRAGWEAANAKRKEDSLAALPDDLPAVRPASAFDVRLALEAPLLESLPGQLRSHCVWSERPAEKGSKNRVWRVERHFGYGPAASIPAGGLYKLSTSNSNTSAVLTVIDDGGILFRHESSRGVWPGLSDGTTQFLLKMSPPLCRGDLWETLKASPSAMSRLIVVVSAADLRREDAEVSKRLSWEQCAESTLSALKHDPIVAELSRAAHVVVNFRAGGALWIAGGTPSPSIRLIFDHSRLEEDFDREFEGTAYGFQTCVVTGIAHQLMAQHVGLDPKSKPGSPFADTGAMRRAMDAGIMAGLAAHRRLLELGHGPVKPARPGAEPAFPTEALGAAVAARASGFVAIDVPNWVIEAGKGPWTVLAESEQLDVPTTPLVGLAHLTARYGLDALSHVPALKLGDLFTVDRSEIESLRALDALIRDYEEAKVQKKPLSIGVFGPPGSGKSFGVKALAQGILGRKLPPGEKVPILEFNLSQFKDTDDLIGALHRVRDAVLKGITPVAFWDEFDSQHYKWLQYLLAPMQDGAFQEGQVTHPIGKCIFVFAGGTSDTIDEFGVREPPKLTPEERKKLSGDAREDRQREEQDYLEFRRLKGPDFVSRLQGFLNVLGVNPSSETDITYPIRRALILRGMLRLKEQAELKIDPGLLNALLSTTLYRHGARSLEKIIGSLTSGSDGGRLYRAALPPDPALERETDAVEFRQLMEQ